MIGLLDPDIAASEPIYEANYLHRKSLPNILGTMLDLPSIGSAIVHRRKSLRLSQTALARKAGISRATLEALENGRARELGFSKITRLLVALGLELKLQAASSHRPTLDELLQEDRDDEALDRRR